MFNFKKKNIYKESNCTISTGAICPKCGGEILESGNYWRCENILSKSCDFSINNILDGEKINIKYLLKFQETEDTEKVYLEIYKKALNKFRLNRDFSFKKTYKIKNAFCPRCWHDIHKIGGAVQCTNKDCNFTMPIYFKGVKLSDKEITAIFKRRVSERYNFKNRDGSIINARLIIDETYSKEGGYKALPRFILVSDASKLTDAQKKRYHVPMSVNSTPNPPFLCNIEIN